ncbi:MAG: tetratricopeptide repeat protein [Magnetococcales bacterium]|nr:tetratricopeptide repeat protein [Magnetococcales bacterium]
MGHRITSGWLALGLAAMFLSATGAFFLVLCRLPGITTCSTQGFATLLVYHVDFAVLVWFLAMAGAFLSVTGPNGPLQGVALLLAWGGAFALLLAPAQGGATPILANYFPVLANGLFLGGMVAMGAGTLLLVVDRLLQGSMVPGILAASLALLCALIAFAVAALALPGPIGAPQTFESLFWAGGHLLQNGHVLLLAALWLWLYRQEVPEFQPPRFLGPLFMVALLPSVSGLFLDHTDPALHTQWMRWGSWWVVPGVVWVLVAEWRRKGWDTPYAWLSVLLLGVGLAMGTVVKEQTLLVPAHYHGTVGAVTLGYMGLARQLLADPEEKSHTLDRWQPWLFAGGVLLLVVGLAVAGFSGLPRKTPGIEHAWEGAARLGMLLAGCGGLLSTASGLLFVVRQVPRWWRMQAGRSGGLLALTALAVAAIAAVIEIWPHPATVTTLSAPAAPPQTEQTELQRRFEQGAVMLHAKEYEHAMTAFHWVLKQAPKLPEAHVNMGFALLGLGRAKAAEDFFRGAIELNPYRANAYYGLAQALEEQKDLRGALGAMRAFIHLTKAEDPFLPKARSALWEWENQLKTPPEESKAPPEEPKTPTE